jgi:hypothetical protein
VKDIFLRKFSLFFFLKKIESVIDLFFQLLENSIIEVIHAEEGAFSVSFWSQKVNSEEGSEVQKMRKCKSCKEFIFFLFENNGFYLIYAPVLKKQQPFVLIRRKKWKKYNHPLICVQ